MQGKGTRTLACGAAVIGFAAGLCASYLSKPATPAARAATNADSARSGRDGASNSPSGPVRSTISATKNGPAGTARTPGLEKTNFAAAGKQAGNMLTERIRNYVRVIMAAEKEDYPDLMRDAMRELGDNGPFSELVIPILAKQWVKTDPVGAFAAVFTGDLAAITKRHFEHEVLQPILEEAAKKDPDGVRKIALENQHLRSSEWILKRLVLLDGKIGAAQSFDTLSKIENPKIAAEAAEGLFQQLANGSDPEQALRMFDLFPNFQPQNDWLERAFFNYAKKDVNDALVTADSLDSENLRRFALQGIASQWVKEDREAALAHVDTISSPALRSEMLAKLNISGIEKDPEASANGALEIPSRRQRNNTIAEVSKQWFRKDTEAATTWMDANLAGEDWDSAASGIVLEKARQHDFKTVAELARRLPADDNGVQQLIRRWKDRDPEAVEDWISSQPVERHAELRKNLNTSNNRDHFGNVVLNQEPISVSEKRVMVNEDGKQVEGVVEEVITIDPETGAEVRYQRFVPVDESPAP